MSEEFETVEHVEVAQPTEATQQLSDKEMNFRALESKAEALEAHNQMMQARIYEFEKSQQRPTQQQQQVEYADDDIPTWGELKRVRESEQQEVNRLKQELKDLRMRANHTDYDETIRNYLPDVLQENPDLAKAIKDNPLMHELAYKLAQASPRYHQDRLAKANEASINKMVDNSNRTHPATSRKTVTVHDEDMKVKSMSDAQVLAMFNMAKARS